MLKFFITPDNVASDRLQATITSGYLISEVVKRWTDKHVVVKITRDELAYVAWQFYEDGKAALDGSFDFESQSLVLDGGSSSQIAEFALWYRSVFPNEHALIYFDEDYMGHFELAESTTKDEILNNL